MAKRLKKIAFRRRREYKTDYKARVALLKSGLPRLVVRKTNKYIIAQIVESKEARDFTRVYVNSKELSKMGFSGSLKSITAAYLTGFLLAQKCRAKKINKAIADLGLYRLTKGSRLYAVIKGAIDNGLDIPCNPEVFPSEETYSLTTPIRSPLGVKIWTTH